MLSITLGEQRGACADWERPGFMFPYMSIHMYKIGSASGS